MKCTNKILSITGFLLFIFIDTIQGVCVTPNNEIGECILLENCDVLYNQILEYREQLTAKQRELIRNSSCAIPENNQYKVCCPQVIKRRISTPPITENTFTPTDFSSHPNLPVFDFKTCGGVPQDKIFKGNKTDPFQYPWMAIIQYKNLKNEIEQNCGGSIITLRFILTAAHCIKNLGNKIKLHSVVVGEHNTKTEFDCIKDECAPPIQTILIDRAIPHPKYNERYFTNDIGVLRLQSLIQQNYGALRICMPITLEMQTQNLTEIIVTGWGKTEHTLPSDELLQALLPTIPMEECNRRYNEFYKGVYEISEIHLCALGEESDTCSGDSGGPAFYPSVSPIGIRTVQYGVVSAGSKECGINHRVPGIYARVVPYVKWILDTCNE